MLLAVGTFFQISYTGLLLTECVTTAVSKLCGIKWLLMSEDEKTKESVIVQIKAECSEALCCGTVYYTKHHIWWFGF